MLMTRGAFIRNGITTSGLAIFAPSLLSERETSCESVELIRKHPVPPSIMLHSREGSINENWKFSDFLDDLLLEGYTTTTYTRWKDSLLEGHNIESPVIISIDDVTARAGQAAWPVFDRMYNELHERNMVAVYGVNTFYAEREMHLESSWERMAQWVDEGGIELATHSDTHVQLNDPFGGPSFFLSRADYIREIGNSATYIDLQLARYGVIHKVTTFITPFGHGYHTTNGLHPGISRICREVGIDFVVGIAHGRSPISMSLIQHGTPSYLGRTVPYNNSGVSTSSSAIYNLNIWRNGNSEVQSESNINCFN